MPPTFSSNLKAGARLSQGRPGPARRLMAIRAPCAALRSFERQDRSEPGLSPCLRAPFPFPFPRLLDPSSSHRLSGLRMASCARSLFDARHLLSMMGGRAGSAIGAECVSRAKRREGSGFANVVLAPPGGCDIGDDAPRFKNLLRC
jgi:hypothetical protein